MKTPKPLTDLDQFPIRGPHYRDLMSKVPALYLLSLIGSDELKEHPEVAAYIDRARRQLKAEAEKENVRKWRDGD